MPVVGHLADPYLAHMDLATPYDRLRDFIDRMATIGDKPEDDWDLRVRKHALAITVLGLIPASALWALIGLLIDRPLLTASSIYFSLAMPVMLLCLARTKAFEPIVRVLRRAREARPPPTTAAFLQTPRGWVAHRRGHVAHRQALLEHPGSSAGDQSLLRDGVPHQFDGVEPGRGEAFAQVQQVAPLRLAPVVANLRQRGIETLYGLGSETAHGVAAFNGANQGGDRGRHFDNVDALNAAVLARLPQVASVLVKGSRFMKMERVVQAIEQSRQQQKEAGHDA